MKPIKEYLKFKLKTRRKSGMILIVISTIIFSAIVPFMNAKKGTLDDIYLNYTKDIQTVMASETNAQMNIGFARVLEQIKPESKIINNFSKLFYDSYLNAYKGAYYLDNGIFPDETAFIKKNGVIDIDYYMRQIKGHFESLKAMRSALKKKQDYGKYISFVIGFATILQIIGLTLQFKIEENQPVHG